MPEIRFDFFQVITIAAIINSLIFSVFLLWKKENQAANYFLSLLLFSIGYSLAAQLCIDLGVYNYYPGLHWLPAKLSYCMGPALYFYVKALTMQPFVFKKASLWHFAWLILEYPHSVYHLYLGRGNPYPRLHNFTEAVGAYALFPLLVYAFLSYRLIKDYQKALQDQYSTTESLTLDWLHQMIRLVAVLLGTAVIIYTVDFRILYDYDMEFFEGTLLQYDSILTFLFIVIIYWLSIGGLWQSQLSLNRTFLVPLDKVNTKDYSGAIDRLVQTMEQQQLFLDPALSISKLAQQTGLAEREISNALNQQLKKNFYAFVNEFRVEEVKQRLLDEKYAHLKILSIAFDAGFNSKATFNRIFKEYTSESPKSYRSTNKAH